MELIRSTSPSIIDLMRDIRLSPTSTLSDDRFLTETQLTNIFHVLLDDILLVIQSLSAAPLVVQIVAEKLLMNVLRAVRNPYEAAAEQAKKRTEHALEKAEEARVETKEALKKAEEARVETKEALKKAEEAREETKEALKKAEEAREETKKAREETKEAREETKEAREETKEALKKAEEARRHLDRDSKEARARIDRLLEDKNKLMLERMMISHDSVPVSVNRAQTWAKVLERNADQQDLEIPSLPEGAMINDPDIQRLQDENYTRESDMYRLFFRHAQKYFDIEFTEGNSGTKIWDTHHSRNLCGYSPDFSITLGKALRPDPYSIVALWEMKLGILDEEAKGQMYDYLVIVARKQPQRRRFVGILSNFNENIVITVTRLHTRNSLEVSSYKPMTIEYAISYLCEIIKDTQYHPPVPAFSIDLGVMDYRLGNQAFNEVAVFKTPKNLRQLANGRWIKPGAKGGDGVSTIVVKRTVPARGNAGPRFVRSEIEILKHIHKQGGHENLPQLFYYSHDYQEFGIEPHGYPIKPGETIIHWRTVLADVLTALRWLHGQHIIHRDVRLDNIIWARDHAVLIDLGASVHCHPAQPTKYQYMGGYICCPPRLLGRFDSMYLPDAADDCHAFLLLVVMLCWPERWKNIRTDDISGNNTGVTLKLKKFWADAKASVLWAKYVAAAEVASYSGLEEMLELCLYFESPNKSDGR